MTTKHFACTVDDVPSDAAKIVTVANLPIGVFRLHDGFYALLNVCPHKGAPLCEGPVCGTVGNTGERAFVYVRAGEIVRCAWHGWEFDIRSGEWLLNPAVKARRFRVSTEGSDLFVHI